MARDGEREPEAILRLSWRTVGTASLAVAIGALGTLAVVATVRNADTLAVIALALAILAFVIQIIVYVAQTWSSSQQMIQAEEVNAETKALLSELRAHAQDTNAVLTNQFNRLLDRLLLVAKDPEHRDEGGAQEVQARVLEEILRTRSELASPGVSASVRAPAAVVHSHRPNVDVDGLPPMAMIRRLTRDGLGGLSEGARRELTTFAIDFVSSGRRQIIDGLGRDPHDSEVCELADAGFVRARENEFGDDPMTFFQLTGKGKVAARLLTAPGPVPPEAMRLLPWLDLERERASRELE